MADVGRSLALSAGRGGIESACCGFNWGGGPDQVRSKQLPRSCVAKTRGVEKIGSVQDSYVDTGHKNRVAVAVDDDEEEVGSVEDSVEKKWKSAWMLQANPPESPF
jgi:hypothetical protein